MTGAPFTLGGYATGSYQCFCAECDDEFTGDKRSLVCLPCAGRQAAVELAAERECGVFYRGEIEKLRAVIVKLIPLASAYAALAKDGKALDAAVEADKLLSPEL